MKVDKVGRNEPCPCGSGRKYKQCHGDQAAEQSRSGGKWMAIVLGGVLLLGALGFLNALANRDPENANAAPLGQVWSEEHQHFH